MPGKLILLLFVVSLMLSAAEGPSIMKIHGTQIYLDGKIKTGDRFLVFGKKGEFKGEVKVMKREKTGLYLAKEVNPAVKDFKADRYLNSDYLKPFQKFDIISAAKIPLFYKGEFFFLEGILENFTCFSENRKHIKFRYKKHQSYIPDEKKLPFGNYYPDKESFLTSYFMVYFNDEDISVPLEYGTEYAVYGELIDGAPYPVFRGLRLLRRSSVSP